MSISSDNGKAPTFSSSSMTIYSQMSLHVFGIGSIGYFSICRNDIKTCRSHINSNIPIITPDSSLINDTKQVRLAMHVLSPYL